MWVGGERIGRRMEVGGEGKIQVYGWRVEDSGLTDGHRRGNVYRRMGGRWVGR